MIILVVFFAIFSILNIETFDVVFDCLSTSVVSPAGMGPLTTSVDHDKSMESVDPCRMQGCDNRLRHVAGNTINALRKFYISYVLCQKACKSKRNRAFIRIMWGNQLLADGNGVDFGPVWNELGKRTVMVKKIPEQIDSITVFVVWRRRILLS